MRVRTEAERRQVVFWPATGRRGLGLGRLGWVTGALLGGNWPRANAGPCPASSLHVGILLCQPHPGQCCVCAISINHTSITHQSHISHTSVNPRRAMPLTGVPCCPCMIYSPIPQGSVRSSPPLPCSSSGKETKRSVVIGRSHSPIHLETHKSTARRLVPA